MHNLKLLAAVSAITGMAMPHEAEPRPRREPPGGPQPELSHEEKERRRWRNKMLAIDDRPANYASLPAKQKAKHRKKRKR